MCCAASLAAHDPQKESPLENKRAASKQARRQKILSAARALLDERGLSMRALALEAGVSLKTPYNLFGSKRDLLACLMDADLDAYKEQVEKFRSKDSLQKIYASLDLAMDIYRREETFHRGLFLAAMDSEDKSLMPIFLKPRILFWKELIVAAMAEKKIKEDTDPAMVSKNIINLFSGCLQEWILGLNTTDIMHSEVGYGISVSLYAAVQEGEKDLILKKIMRYQKLTHSLRQKYQNEVQV